MDRVLTTIVQVDVDDFPGFASVVETGFRQIIREYPLELRGFSVSKVLSLQILPNSPHSWIVTLRWRKES